MGKKSAAKKAAKGAAMWVAVKKVFKWSAIAAAGTAIVKVIRGRTSSTA